MKNNRMLSIGKCNFSPKREQTPNARSSKNNLSFSMDCGGLAASKLKIMVFFSIIQLDLRMFRICSILFLMTFALRGYGGITVPESKYLTDASLSPYKLKLEGDSIRFVVKGTIPVESAITAKNPKIKLVYYSDQKHLEFGEIPLHRKLSHYEYEFRKSLKFEPWMLDAILELQYFQGKKETAKPLEKKILAKGIIAPQLMVKLGEVYPDEPIPDVGLFMTSGLLDRGLVQTGEFVFFFDLGNFQLKNQSSQQREIQKIRDFLKNYPEVLSFRITGLQSPESAEGKNSKLGMDRAMSVKKSLNVNFPGIPDSIKKVDSRRNDWFDLRLLLKDFEGISTQRKDEMYAVLTNNETFLQQYERLRKIPGFSQVEKDLFPKLRAVKVSIQAKPRLGLDQEQTHRLNESLKSNSGKTSLTFAEWALAGEATSSLEEKALIYSKMTEFFRSPLPYNNMAVVRMRQAQRTLDEQSKELLWAEAERLLNQAIKIDSNPHSFHNLGQILALRGEHWEAYKKLSEASIGLKDPELVKVNEALRGALDILRGDYKLASLRFDYQFTDPKDFFNKGLAYFMTGEYAKANMSFEESVLSGRNFGYGYYGLAMIAASSGQKEIALIQLKKAINSNRQLAKRAYSDPLFQELREEEDFFTAIKEN
jgi:tetratricopeptide (TPR) repeat protein